MASVAPLHPHTSLGRFALELHRLARRDELSNSAARLRPQDCPIFSAILLLETRFVCFSKIVVKSICVRPLRARVERKAKLGALRNLCRANLCPKPLPSGVRGPLPTDFTIRFKRKGIKCSNGALMIPMKCRDEPNESLFVFPHFYCPARRDFGRSSCPLPDQRSECMQISKF